MEWLQLLMVVLSTPWNGTSDNFWVGFGYFLVSWMLGLHEEVLKKQPSPPSTVQGAGVASTGFAHTALPAVQVMLPTTSANAD